MRFRPWNIARSVLLGWAALFVITYCVERPLLFWTGPRFGADWIPTVRLALTCVTLVATGWIVGRLNRSQAVASAFVFAVLLAMWDFGLVPALNLAWLFRLFIDTYENARYFETLLVTATTQALLFGCIFAGALLSRHSQAPASLLNLR
jgi:hypothetical protein